MHIQNLSNISTDTFLQPLYEKVLVSGKRCLSFCQLSDLLIPSEYLSSLLVLSGVRVTRSLVLYVCFVDHCLSFELFLLTIALSVLLRYMDSDYPFGIFKLFFGC
jgi:hypothetical protein